MVPLMHCSLQHSSLALTSRFLLGLKHRRYLLGRYKTSLRALTVAMAAAGPPVHLHAATPAELATARSVLAGANLLAHKPGSDREVQHLHLSFNGDASEPSTSSAFDATAYFAELGDGGVENSASTSSPLGRMLLTAAAVSSTQEVVQENAVLLPDGLVFVADRQASGKGGQPGRSWWGASILCTTWLAVVLPSQACVCLFLSFGPIPLRPPQAAAAMCGTRLPAASCSRLCAGWLSLAPACPLSSTLCRWRWCRRRKTRQRVCWASMRGAAAAPLPAAALAAAEATAPPLGP